MSNTIFDSKFWGTSAGVLIATTCFFSFGMIPIDMAISNFILAIVFYLYGRIDSNG